jgi:hypothetical protein
MSIDRYHHATLDQPSLAEIQLLEQELSIILVAVEPDPAPAQLSEQALKRLQALEQQTGTILVAYNH